MKSSERLTAIEASFMELERADFPMHVGGLVLVKGTRPLTTEELRRLVAERLKRVDRFHQKPHWALGGLWPEWVPAGRLKPAAHFFHHVLVPHGSEPELRQLCAAIHEGTLDRDRPLWEMHLIDGVVGGRQALLIKTHHAITDGMAAMEIAEMLFDPAPGAREPALPVMRFADASPPSPLMALKGLVGMAYTLAGGPLALEGPFNGPVSGRRAFGTAMLSLQAVRRVKRQLGASVDDVVTATVAAGIGAYLHEVGYPSAPRALRAMLPVSTRGPARRAPIQNQVSAIFIDLPMDVEDLPELVRRVAEQKATLRTAHAVAGSAMAVEAAALLPAPVRAAVLRFTSGLPFANLVLSDVPGPDQDLYLLGRRVLACYPMMPLAKSVGLSVASISLNGVIAIGVTADPGLLPDAQRLASRIEQAWEAFAGSRVVDAAARLAA